MSKWLDEVYGEVDRLDAEAFAQRFAPDGTFCFANGPVLTGPAEIAAGVGAFFASIRGLRHFQIGQWQVEDAAITQAEVTYTRHDGSEVTIPAVTVYRLTGDGKVRAGHAYIDLAPLYAA